VIEVSVIAYLISAIAHLYNLLTAGKLPGWAAVGPLLIGFVFHTVMLGYSGMAGQSRGLWVWLNAAAWFLALLYLFVYARYREMALGGFAVPAVFVLAGYSAALWEVSGTGSLEMQGFLLKSHAFLALLSACCFFLLFASALMYVVQARQLKSRRPGAWLHRLPPLDVLDDLNHKILYFGFTFLTASLLLGSMWAQSKHDAFWAFDPLKTWPLVLIWLGYGLLLVCRVTRSWKGKRSAFFSMGAFVAVVLAIVIHL